MKNINKSILISLCVVTFFNIGCNSVESKFNQRMKERTLDKVKLFNEYDKILRIADTSNVDIDLFRNTYYYVIDNYDYPFKYNEFHNLLSNYSVKIALDSTKRDMHNYLLIQELIKKELDLNPFEGLDDNQKNLLMRFKKTLDGNELVSAKIILKDDIKNLLLNQNREIDSLQLRNTILSIVSILLTLLFGSLQLFYPKGIRDILKKYTRREMPNELDN